MPDPRYSYVETHAHLDFADYTTDREKLIDEIFNSGCLAVVNPGIDISSSHASLELARRYTRIFSAVGIHPHEAAQYVTSGDDVFDFLYRDIQTLERLVDKQNVVAIGECGLDFYRLKIDDPLRSKIIEVQKELFRQQLGIAKKNDLPVIMHIREAHEDVLELLDMTQGIEHGVAHCNEGTWVHTQALLAMGMHIGFTANITYPKKEKMHEIIRKVPIERILLETDSPFLSPQERRGKRNDPRSVVDVGFTVAKIKNISPQEVFVQTTKNAISLFGLPIL